MTAIAIYTDLDGSLLDHDDYSFEPAESLLHELEQADIPVVPCTSKTRAEVLVLREALNNWHPFIVENGAAVFIPTGYFEQQPQGSSERDGFWVKEFSEPHVYWLGVLQQVSASLAAEAKFTSFSRMAMDEIVQATGLSTADASLARQREYGEPVQWLGNEEDRETFIAELQQMGARVLQGGRFLHVSGMCDKGTALRWLNEQYRRTANGKPPQSIAIGDSQNDVGMLEAADHALIVRSPVHAPPTLQRSKSITISTLTGPKGWDEGVQKILTKLHASPR